LGSLDLWDKEYVWHPFTQMQEYRGEQIPIIERGEGSYLIDTDGNRYLDGISSLWVTVHGHCHQEINRAVQSQMEKISHSTLLGLANVPSILLAKKLVEITPPGLNKVFYSDAGATAVEIALKIAFQYWRQTEGGQQKQKFIYLENSYHGDTVGAVSVGGIELFHSLYRPLLFQGYKIPSPYCYRCPVGKEKKSCRLACLEPLEELLAAKSGEIAALIIEPLVQGAAGLITSPPGYLKRVRELCSRFNVLVIADEVAVGFGRTGSMFACAEEGVAPDLMCLAKGLTGGYLPLAATLATNEIYAAFLGSYREQNTFFHGHTYTGNPLACAAALASLDLFEKNRVIEGLQAKIAVLAEGLKSFEGLPWVGEIRQKGMMVGMELVQDKETKEPFPLALNIGHVVTLEARKRGLITRPLGNVLVLMPILSMDKEELEKMLAVLYDSLRAAVEHILGKTHREKEGRYASIHSGVGGKGA